MNAKAKSKQFTVEEDDLKCRMHEVNDLKARLRDEWLTKFLARVGVASVMIKKRVKGEFGNSAWRDYMLRTVGVTVNHNLAKRQVSVYKIDRDTLKRTEIGRWSDPEVTQHRSGNKIGCRLRLRYWELV